MRWRLLAPAHARRVRIVLAAAMVLGAAACGSSASRAPSAEAAPQAAIDIGALFSLTGGGDVYGPQQANGARLAVKQIDAAGGVDGVPLRLIVRNDRSDPVAGASEMRDLITGRRVVAVLGPTLSLVAVRADPLADSLQTPVLGISNTVDGIVGDCAYPCSWIWRDSLAERIAVRANVDAYVRAHHPSTALTVQSADDVLGSDDVKHAAVAFRDEGVRVLGRLSLPADGDPRAALEQALSQHPDVLFVGTSFGAFAAKVMQLARKDGFRGQILGGNTFNSEQTRRLAGAAGIGARSGAAWYSGNDFPANQQFITDYEQQYGTPPDQFAAQAYAGVQILADALHRSRAAAASTLVEQRTALQRGLGDVARSSVLGPFRFTADHDVEQIVWILEMDKGGHHLVGFCNPGC